MVTISQISRFSLSTSSVSLLQECGFGSGSPRKSPQDGSQETGFRSPGIR